MKMTATVASGDHRAHVGKLHSIRIHSFDLQRLQRYRKILNITAYHVVIRYVLDRLELLDPNLQDYLEKDKQWRLSHQYALQQIRYKNEDVSMVTDHAQAPAHCHGNKTLNDPDSSHTRKLPCKNDKALRRSGVGVSATEKAADNYDEDTDEYGEEETRSCQQGRRMCKDYKKKHSSQLRSMINDAKSGCHSAKYSAKSKQGQFRVTASTLDEEGEDAAHEEESDGCTSAHVRSSEAKPLIADGTLVSGNGSVKHSTSTACTEPSWAETMWRKCTSVAEYSKWLESQMLETDITGRLETEVKVEAQGDGVTSACEGDDASEEPRQFSTVSAHQSHTKEGNLGIDLRPQHITSKVRIRLKRGKRKNVVSRVTGNKRSRQCTALGRNNKENKKKHKRVTMKNRVGHDVGGELDPEMSDEKLQDNEVTSDEEVMNDEEGTTDADKSEDHIKVSGAWSHDLQETPGNSHCGSLGLGKSPTDSADSAIADNSDTSESFDKEGILSTVNMADLTSPADNNEAKTSEGQLGKVKLKNQKHRAHKPKQKKEQTSLPKKAQCERELKVAKKRKRVQIAYNSIPRLCPVCGSMKKNMKRHLLTHTGQKLKCDFCDHESWTEGELRIHMKYHDKEQHAKFVCDYCEKRFMTQCQKRYHIDSAHLGIKPFSCEQCDRMFPKKSDLLKHVHDVHLQLRPHVCTWADCEKAFKRASHLEQHMRLHTGEAPYKCTRCDYAAKQPISLTSHMSSKHGISKGPGSSSLKRKKMFKQAGEPAPVPAPMPAPSQVPAEPPAPEVACNVDVQSAEVTDIDIQEEIVGVVSGDTHCVDIINKSPDLSILPAHCEMVDSGPAIPAVISSHIMWPELASQVISPQLLPSQQCNVSAVPLSQPLDQFVRSASSLQSHTNSQESTITPAPFYNMMYGVGVPYLCYPDQHVASQQQF